MFDREGIKAPDIAPTKKEDHVRFAGFPSAKIIELTSYH